MSRRTFGGNRATWVVGPLVLAQSVTGATVAHALPTDAPTIRVSSDTARNDPRALNGATVTGWAAIFVDAPPDTATYSKVDFHLDDPERTKPPTSTDTSSPWDFNGTHPCGAVDPCPLGAARLYDTTTMRQGTHTVTVVAQLPGSAAPVQVSTATFVVQHAPGEPVRLYLDPVSAGVATSTADAGKFLYTGEYPTQSGVASETIDAARAAIVRGRVTKRDGTPVVNAAVTVAGHPEFGSTKTRADGWYDLVVNAGEPLTVNLAATGYPAVARSVDPEPQAWSVVDDAVLVPYDTNAVVIDTAAIPAGDFAAARGSTVTDDDGTRTSTVLVPSGTSAQLRMPDAAMTSYTWSGGRLTGATSPDGVTVTPGYTSGLPTSATWSGAVSGSVAHTFDDEMNVDSETVGGTPAVSFGRDADGLLTIAGAETLTRHAQNGSVTGTTLGQTATAWTYSSFGEPDTFTASYAGSAVYDVDYAVRDKAGRIVQQVETTDGATHTTSYAYTSANRLDAVTVDGVEMARYGYDTAGNVTTETTASGVVSSTFDAQDRIKTRGSVTYGFDADGQRVSAADGAAETTYGWSVGRLASVSLPGGVAVGYKYDAFGNRVAKTVGGAVVRGYLWSGARLVAETDATGSVLSRFVYGSRAHVPDYLVQGGVTYRLVTDERGSVRLVLNAATGAVAQRIAYDAWGRVTSDTSPGFQPFGFAGGIADTHTGLVRFGSRDYDPLAKQWLSRDTIGFSGGTNQYAYADGDPVNRIDPTGHSAIGCFADILGLLGMIPVVGTVFDVASALLYVANGDWGTARLALAGIILPIGANQLKGISRFGDEAAQAGGPGAIPSPIWREGTPSPSNLTVRPGESAVSFRDSLSNPWVPSSERPPNWRPVFRPGEPYFSVDTRKLPPGSVNPDNIPPGHVSVAGVGPDVLREAVTESPPWPRFPK